ncbi:hypothetical protein Salat_2304300 [Sesamum alatum]|uniref:Leucine-rich repeat-containing N-terminal plant-type domain-containing protein n=1 Tax=Sesamum alatum TaxID=300844 RepID=A0AAE1XVS7_9LAMI|nr:hypothetical protein Salat_2304300 [Sesamum alatum]
MFSSVFFILLFFSNLDLGINLTFVSGQCLQGQKELLLELRNNLTYDSSFSTKLVQWSESIDCCRWAGVKCDTWGRVSGLDLSGEAISDGINGVGSSLFGLVFLENLSLAQNSFSSIDLPFGFGKLTELSYLNPSNSGFSVKLENPNLGKLIHNFARLRELYLDGVNISANGYEWCNAISSSLSNLRVLSLSNAYLTGPFESSLKKGMRPTTRHASTDEPACCGSQKALWVRVLLAVNAPIASLKASDFINEDSDNFLYFEISEAREKGMQPTTRHASTDEPTCCGSQKVLWVRVLLAANAPIASLKASDFINEDSDNFFYTSYNTFSSPFLGFFADFSSFKVLTISSCNLSGVAPAKLFQVKSLETVDLSGNRDLEGSLPEFPFEWFSSESVA